MFNKHDDVMGKFTAELRVAQLEETNAELLEALEMVINETNAGMWDCLPIHKAKEAIRKAREK